MMMFHEGTIMMNCAVLYQYVSALDSCDKGGTLIPIITVACTFGGLEHD